MFKRSVLTLLSLVVAFNCLQQTYAATSVQSQHNTNRYETIKNGVIKYSNIAADVVGVGLGLSIMRALFKPSDFYKPLLCAKFALSPIPLSQEVLIGYGIKNLYEAYREHNNPSAHDTKPKHSYKAALGNTLVAVFGLATAAFAGLVLGNKWKEIPRIKKLAIPALIAYSLRSAYLASRNAYRNLTAESKTIGTKKV